MTELFYDNTEAYLHMCDDVLHNFDHETAPRGMKIREKLNYQVSIQAPDVGPIETFDADRNKIIASYTKREMEWYKSGDRSAASAPTEFWQTLADSKGNINSNYGYLVMFDESEGRGKDGGLTPFEWALQSLSTDMDSRQAIMRYNKPTHCKVGTKDLPCTMYQAFHIRDGLLHSTVRMRSADLFTGPVYDLPWFSYVMYEAVKYLRNSYPNLNCGTLTFSADSLHIYEKDFDRIKQLITENEDA